MADKQSGLENFSGGTDNIDLDDRIDEDEPESVLYHYFRNFKWDFSGIRRQNGDPIPVPASSKCVTAILEEVSMKDAEQMAEDLGARLIRSNSRQYPDVNLRNAFGDNLIALDFKSTRIKDSGKITGMTLGSCGKYFSNPGENTQYSRFAYGSYDDHWVVCFAYKWDENRSSENMVYDIETLIGKKWEFANNPTNTNSTNQINSQTDLRALRNRNPHFDSKRDFEEQWREYGND
jgi:hypothetical protein